MAFLEVADHGFAGSLGPRPPPFDPQDERSDGDGEQDGIERRRGQEARLRRE